MKVATWLAINSRGGIRTRKTKPGLDWNEVAIKLNIELPDALFEKPHLEATVIIPKEAVASDVLSAEVVANTKEAIETATGLNFVVSVVKEEPE